MEPQPQPIMRVNRAQWFAQYHGACVAIARYVASQPIRDPELQRLIEEWQTILQDEVTQG